MFKSVSHIFGLQNIDKIHFVFLQSTPKKPDLEIPTSPKRCSTKASLLKALSRRPTLNAYLPRHGAPRFCMSQPSCPRFNLPAALRSNLFVWRAHVTRTCASVCLDAVPVSFEYSVFPVCLFLLQECYNSLVWSNPMSSRRHARFGVCVA